MSKEQQKGQDLKFEGYAQKAKDSWEKLASRSENVISKFSEFRKAFANEKRYESMDISFLMEERMKCITWAETLSGIKQSLFYTQSSLEFQWKSIKKKANNDRRKSGGTAVQAELAETLTGSGYYLEHVHCKGMMYRAQEARESALKMESMLNSQISYAKQEAEKKQFIDSRNG